MATKKQLAANQANAQLSTGAVTPQGKFICSHNAVKTGLTGQTVLLKTDDVEAYNQHILRFTNKFAPVNDDERALVQDLADTEWRLARITPLEAGVLALGRRALAAQFADEADLATRDSLLEAQVIITYRRDLSNLSLQQTRLRKHRQSVTQELTGLQAERKQRTKNQSERAAEFYSDAVLENWPMELADFGFDFVLGLPNFIRGPQSQGSHFKRSASETRYSTFTARTRLGAL